MSWFFWFLAQWLENVDPDIMNSLVHDNRSNNILTQWFYLRFWGCCLDVSRFPCSYSTKYAVHQSDYCIGVKSFRCFSRVRGSCVVPWKVDTISRRFELWTIGVIDKTNDNSWRSNTSSYDFQTFILALKVMRTLALRSRTHVTYTSKRARQEAFASWIFIFLVCGLKNRTRHITVDFGTVGVMNANNGNCCWPQVVFTYSSPAFVLELNVFNTLPQRSTAFTNWTVGRVW